MSLFMTCAVGVSACAAVYLGRKGWHAFHHMVGIEPEVMTYEPSRVGYAQVPKLLAINIDKAVLQSLPADALAVIERLDNKAKRYRQWQQTLQVSQSNGKNHNKQNLSELPDVALTEAHFVVVKLLHERLPEIVNIYANFAANQTKVQLIQKSGKSAVAKTVDFYGMTKNQQQAYQTLMALLADIEQRLDELIADCEQQQLQQLKMMARYLDSR